MGCRRGVKVLAMLWFVGTDFVIGIYDGVHDRGNRVKTLVYVMQKVRASFSVCIIDVEARRV